MPVSELTTAARAASARLYVGTFPRIEGNMQMLLLMATQDAETVKLLGEEVAASSAPPPGMAASLASEAAMLAKLPEWSGNIGLWSLAYAASGNIWNACDYLDALPDPPILLGNIVAAQTEPNPLVMLAPADTPLKAAAVDGSSVMVEGSQWPSINGRMFTITVADRALAQFHLVEADTTGELLAAVGGTVFLLPP
jgi:hypothetical protein